MSSVVQVFSGIKKQSLDFQDSIDNWSKEFSEAIKNGMAPKSLSSPIFVLWELTGKCPQNCVYCYNGSPKKVEELTSKQLFDVADQIIEAKIFNICLSGGEPTMRPEYFHLLEYLATSGIQVGTVLSGWNIDPKRARHIAYYANTVQVSLDGSSAEIHDSIRRRTNSFNDAINAIKHFVSLGTQVNVSFAVTKDNVDDFPAVYKLCEDIGVATLRTQKLTISGKVKSNSDFVASDKAYIRLKQYMEEYKGGKTEIVYGDPTTHVNFGKDFGMSVMARITAEGYMGISPYLDIFFGDLKEDKFKDIWESMKEGWHNQTVLNLLNNYVMCENEVIKDAIDGKIFIRDGK
ncbi:radical SAM protein [Ruminiclostridium herbifermentans]|uniref:Radical SAM protein n=1 Tax=Ruminiclostridium herbifermentans TaxID=2488810 RepID=A0A4U7JKM0_9FIRM|nr:radical SAM protein [Ruminiclostridium herbifermentans]QNU67064.1 radical SAM protein [Ruminiclostridium herbifermentans]